MREALLRRFVDFLMIFCIFLIVAIRADGGNNATEFESDDPIPYIDVYMYRVGEDCIARCNDRDVSSNELKDIVLLARKQHRTVEVRFNSERKVYSYFLEKYTNAVSMTGVFWRIRELSGGIS